MPKNIKLGPTFSEFAKKAKLPRRITRLANKLAKEMAVEFERRLKEGIGLYRPWDDDKTLLKDNRPSSEQMMGSLLRG